MTGAATAARRLGRDWPALLGLAVIIVSTAAAVAAPALAPTDPVRNDLLARLTPPMWVAGGDRAHPLGTDTLGRDVLSRLLYGARVSLVIGLTAVVLAGAAGVVLGLIAGYYRGWLDDVLMRVGDIQLAFPVLLLGVALLSVLGASLANLIAVLALSGWVTYARVVRGQTLSLRETDFIQAARGLGCPAWWILLRHVLPNVVSYALVIMTTEIGRLIVLESTLSFLGLGVPPPTPSWGMALADGKEYLINGWWLATFPGLAIMMIVLSMNVLGDGARDLLEPRLRGRARRG